MWTLLFFLLTLFCVIVAVVGLFNPTFVTAGKIRTRAGAFLAYLGAALVCLFAMIVPILNDPDFQARQAQKRAETAAAAQSASQAASAQAAQPAPADQVEPATQASSPASAVQAEAAQQTAAISVPQTAPATSTPSAMPDLEAQFIAINQSARRAYQTASNDVAAGAVRRDRATALCRLMEMMEVREWIGKITKMSSTGSGDGRVEIKIAENILLGSAAAEDVIEAQSYAGRALAKMNVGDRVIFDGMFYRNDTDCLYEWSWTQKGSVMDPEYKFHFTDFRPTPAVQ